MGFFHDKAAEILDAVNRDDMDTAGRLTVHAWTEGAGSQADNAKALADAMKDNNGKR